MDKRTGIIVDLDNLAQNIKNLKDNLPKGTKLAAVVKADAYGHGALKVSKAAINSGADLLCFATARETMEILKEDIDAPILVMGPPMDDTLDLIVDFRVRQCVFLCEHILSLQKKAEEKGLEAYVHVKVDTGMNRIGVKHIDEFKKLLETLIKCDRVIFEGMFTHFAASDEADKTFSNSQISKFEEFTKLAVEYGFKPILHACNSGAIIDLPQYGYDFVRAGISMYGYYPSNKVMKDKVKLKPVMSVYTHVAHIKKIVKGETISYGRTFKAKEDMVIATLPIGYGDGFNRLLSNKGDVLIGGQRAKILGRVCMDMTIVDISNISGVKVGDEAIVIGKQGKEEITADEHARICGTISYEILLSFTSRVLREYKE
jgi:alanine racemase